MEWMDVEISVDLISAARRHLHFLDNIDNVEKLLNNNDLLDLSIRRYEQLWLPLVDEYRSTQIVAPIDIAWMWYCHMLCPLAYRRDCRLILKRTLKHRFARSRDVIESTNNAIEVWYEKYPKDGFNIIRNGEYIKASRKIGKLTESVSRLSVNLLEIAKSQLDFCYQVALPHYKDGQYLATALRRYKQFLCMKRASVDDFITPPVDIMLMWFTHMCHPIEYATDTMKACGRVLENNVRIRVGHVTEKFRSAASDTCNKWTSVSKENLIQPGTKFRTRDTKSDINEMKPEDLKSCCVVMYKLSISHAEIMGLPSKMRRFRVRMHLLHSDSSKDEIIILKGSKRQRIWNFKSTVSYVTNIHRGLRVALTMDNNLMCLQDENTFAFGSLKLTPLLESMRQEEKCLSLNIDMSGQLVDDTKIRMQLDGKVEEAKPLTCILHLLNPNEGFTDLILGTEDLMQTFGRSVLADHRKSHRCFLQKVKLRNHEDEECFTCRVMHIQEQLFSGVQVFFYDKLMATSYVIGSSQLPSPTQVARSDLSMAFDPDTGERAMLIRNAKGDWGLCIGRWAKVDDDEFLKIRFMTLSKNKLKTLEVRSVDLHFQSFYANLLTGAMSIDPSNNMICENIALVFTISILHVLCSPENLNRRIKSTLVTSQDNVVADTQSVTTEATVPESACAFLLAAGLNTTTPNNTYMSQKYGSFSVDLSFDAQDIFIEEVKVDRSIFKKDSKLSKYDFDEDSPRRLKVKKHSKSNLVDSPGKTKETVDDSKVKTSETVKKEGKPKKIKKRRSTKFEDELCPSDDSLDLAVKEEMQYLQKKGTETATVIESKATQKLLKKKKSTKLQEELVPSEDSLDEADKEWGEYKNVSEVNHNVVTEQDLITVEDALTHESGIPHIVDSTVNSAKTTASDQNAGITDTTLNTDKSLHTSEESHFVTNCNADRKDGNDNPKLADPNQRSAEEKPDQMRHNDLSSRKSDVNPDDSPDSGSLTPVETDVMKRKKRKRKIRFDKENTSTTIMSVSEANHDGNIVKEEKKADFYL